VAVAIGLLLALPARPVVLVGSQRPDRISASSDALRVRLDRRDCYRLIEAAEGVPLP
jgi:predicted oxidoreductase